MKKNELSKSIYKFLSSGYSNVRDFCGNNQKGLFVTTILVVFAFIYALNYFTPMLFDDFLYSFIFLTEQRVDGISDILHSLYKHYYEWGGRMVAHFFLQFFLLCGKHIFNFFNAGMYVALTLLIYFHINIARPINLKLYLIVNVLMWFFIPAFGETILWFAGSCNYLWCAVLIFSFLMPYRLYTVNPGLKLNIILLIPFMLLAFFSGWTNENTGGAMILAAILFMLYYKYVMKVAIPKWAVIALIFAVCGYILLVVAPGNYVRASAVGYNDRSIFIKILVRLFAITKGLYEENAYSLFFIITVLIILLKSGLGKKRDKMHAWIVAIYFVASLGAAYSMVSLYPPYNPRVWFGTFCFLFLVIGILYLGVSDNYIVKRVVNCMLLFLLIPLGVSYWNAFTDAKHVSDFIENRTSYILEQKKAGEKYVDVEFIRAKNPYNPRFTVVDEVKSYGYKDWTALYFGIDSIRVVGPCFYNVEENDQ